MSNTTQRLLDAPYAHHVARDNAGNSHVTLSDSKGQSVTIVAPTFEEAATRALDWMEAQS